MATTTRVIHKVRCRSTADPMVWADVTILDDLILTMPNGKQFGYFVGGGNTANGATCTPYIADPTNDGNQQTPAISSTTRISHMEQISGSQDPSQLADFEILDHFNVTLSFEATPFSLDAGEGVGQENDMGYADSGQYGGPPRSLFMQANQAVGGSSVMAIADPTGLKLDVPYVAPAGGGGGSTRVGHINIVTNMGDTDSGTSGITVGSDGSGGQQVNPQGTPYLVTVKTDLIAFAAPNRNTILIEAPKSNQNDIDLTQYGADPYNPDDTMAPPDNKDPNKYVYFPDPSKNQSGGPNSGQPQNDLNGINMQSPTYTNATVPANTGPINQGILWWVSKISAPPPPWFWYMQIYELLAFSFFAGGGAGLAPVHWGYRGFQLTNWYPVIWILAENNPLQVMGIGGANSLEDAALNGYQEYMEGDYQDAFTNWGGIGIPNFAGYTAGAGPSFVEAPYGVLPMQDPPLPENLFQYAVPNIWQLTGLTQPNLTNPNKPYNGTTNPYLPPTTKQASTAANTFANFWNNCANTLNKLFTSWVPGGSNDPNGGGTITPQPNGWKWKTPYYWPNVTRSSEFQSGIPTLLLEGGGGPAFPIEEYDPINIWNCGVGTLDPGEWNLSGIGSLMPMQWKNPKPNPKFNPNPDPSPDPNSSVEALSYPYGGWPT